MNPRVPGFLHLDSQLAYPRPSACGWYPSVEVPAACLPPPTIDNFIHNLQHLMLGFLIVMQPWCPMGIRITYADGKR